MSLSQEAAALDVFLVAGEPSGDALGADLMRALALQATGSTFRGVGGAAMERAGLASLFAMSDIAVMGFLPVVARLPTLLSRIAQTAEAIIARPPHVLVIVDSPDFTHRVARRVRKALPRLPIVDYVSPTVWAWRPGRARAMRGYVDHVLALLPFEPAAHVRLGGPACTYVGHPLIERRGDLEPSMEETARRAAAPPRVVVLPGSRRSEVAALTDIFGETLSLLAGEFPDMEIVLPTVPHVEAIVRERVARWRIAPRVVTGEADKFAAFRSARAALAASGTVTLELALAQTPTVVAYKVSKIEEWIARRLVVTEHAALPNIVLGERLLPELLQDEARPQRLAAELAMVLRDGPERQRQMMGLRRVSQAMQLADGERPSALAARIVIAVANARR